MMKKIIISIPILFLILIAYIFLFPSYWSYTLYIFLMYGVFTFLVSPKGIICIVAIIFGAWYVDKKMELKKAKEKQS
jgi:hypothetical protein